MKGCAGKRKKRVIFFFLFRENKKDAYGGTQSYTFLGRVSIERLQGSQPHDRDLETCPAPICRPPHGNRRKRRPVKSCK